MIKIPKTAEITSPEFIADRTQFFHDYAALLLLWGQFEFALEVAIARLAGLTPPDASIILGGLSFGNKPPMLYSLLAKRGKPDASAKVKAVINHVGRNALVHGIAGSDYETRDFAFFRREVGEELVVKHILYTADTFNAHFERFRDLADAALDALGISDADLSQFAREAGLLEPTPPRLQDRPQCDARDNKSARKKRRREARKDQ